MKKFSRILKCTAAAAVCALTLSGCDKYNKMMDEDPQGYINLAAENTTEAMVKSAFAEEAAIIEKALTNGTAGFSFDIEGVKFNADAYVNEGDKKTSQLYTLEIGGEKVDIYLAADDATAKFGTVSKSGEHIYEINAKTLEEDLKGSIFAPGSGSSLEIPQEDFDMITEALGEAVAVIEGGEEELPESYAEIEKLVNEMMSEVVVEKKVDITIDETEVNANILTFNFDKEDMMKLLDAYADIAVEEMVAQGEEVSKEEIMAELNTDMESISKMDIELVYYVNSKTHCLMQVDCKVDATVTEDEETQDIKADIVAAYGADPENSDEVSINMTVEIDDEKLTVDVISERKSENETEVKINAAMQGATMELVVLNFEKDGENYEISAEVPLLDAEATVKGTFKTADKSVEATVDSVAYAMNSQEIEGSVESLNIKCYIKQGGEFVDKSAKKFFELTEEELMTAVEEIGNDFGALAGNSPVGGPMLDYIDKSKQASANANAKTVHTAFAAALTYMSIEGAEFEDFEFYNATSGDYNVVANGYELNLSEYLGDDFPGYYYVNLDPYTYAVNFALWSETPIEYHYQYSRYDQEMFAEEGQYIGCYPISEY